MIPQKVIAKLEYDRGQARSFTESHWYQGLCLAAAQINQGLGEDVLREYLTGLIDYMGEMLNE